MVKSPAVFLDRDGTLIQEAEYLADPAGVRLLPQAAAGIRQLKAAGFLVLMASNQSGVARGYFGESTVQRINQRMQDLLTAEHAPLDGMYYCPHYPESQLAAYAVSCDCRKPAPGMLYQAAKDFNLDLARSWVIGDKASDLAFGKRAGLRAILVLTGYGEKTLAQGFTPGEEPDSVASDLKAAAQIILARGT